jgi:sugar (pentulose or hexulose) kinase
MLSDVIGRRMVIPRVGEASAFGAAGLAMIGLGLVDSLEDVARRVAVNAGPSPNDTNLALYRRLYRLYFDVYWANQKGFEDIASLQEELG